MMMTTMPPSAAAPKTADPAQPQQVAPAAEAADAQAAPAQPNAPAQAAAVQPFAAWLGDQAGAAMLTVQAGLPADDVPAQAADKTIAGPAHAAGDGADGSVSAAASPQDGALLAAMAMPLMPLSPTQVAQAIQAAQPAARSGDDTKEASDAPAVAAVGIDGGRRAALQGEGLALQQQPQVTAAPAARSAQPDALPAVRLAVHAQADAGAANTGANTQDSGADHASNGNGNATPGAAIAGALASQPSAGAPAGSPDRADTVKLAGPPTAWRQSLQEALGERMHVQVGKGIEQAVIRLEPPQLGRIDIAIRHSAGTLEVNISATNSDVLRQLQNVSDNLRSDLSQRQFSEVAVTVTPAQKNSAAPFGDSQQGRGRRQDREQEDQQPGHALAEADNNASVFSLGARS